MTDLSSLSAWPQTKVMLQICHACFIPLSLRLGTIQLVKTKAIVLCGGVAVVCVIAGIFIHGNSTRKRSTIPDVQRADNGTASALVEHLPLKGRTDRKSVV